jgi:hypothetical protein
VNRDPLPIRTSSDQSNMADKELTLDVESTSCEKEQNGPDAAVDHSPLDKKILLKLDLVVLPVIAMLYLLVFIDRANVGNARVVSHPSRIFPSKVEDRVFGNIELIAIRYRPAYRRSSS